MEFAAPEAAWLAVPVAVTLFLELRGERLRDKALRRLAEPHLLPGLVSPEGRLARVLRLATAPLVMLLLILALMRPQWGPTEEAVASPGADVLFALDLSRSMLADDVTPSRLAAAKAAIAKAVELLPDDRIGLIGFAGSSFLLCPLTSDREMLRRILDAAGTGSLPKGGTSMAPALDDARRVFRRSLPGGRLLIVMTDGEDHAGALAPAIAALRGAGVAVVASLVGTASGGLMPLPGGRFVKDQNGAVVKSCADIRALQAIDPAACDISADTDVLAKRLQSECRALRKTARTERRQKLAERYQYPLGAALLLWGGSELARRRKRSS